MKLQLSGTIFNGFNIEIDEELWRNGTRHQLIDHLRESLVEWLLSKDCDGAADQLINTPLFIHDDVLTARRETIYICDCDPEQN